MKNLIYDSLKLAEDISITYENRYSEKKENYYSCVVLNVCDKSTVIGFDIKTFNNIKNILNKK